MLEIIDLILYRAAMPHPSVADLVQLTELGVERRPPHALLFFGGGLGSLLQILFLIGKPTLHHHHQIALQGGLIVWARHDAHAIVLSHRSRIEDRGIAEVAAEIAASLPNVLSLGAVVPLQRGLTVLLCADLHGVPHRGRDLGRDLLTHHAKTRGATEAVH